MLNQAREKLIALQQKMAAYDHATDSIHYDGETAAPKGTAANRAQTLGILNAEMYKLRTGEETLELLEFLDEHKEELSQKEQRMVYLLLKDLRTMKKIPMDEYVAYQKLLVESEAVWEKAKQNNDFESYLPYLEKVFATTKKFAEYCAPEKDPYDYWLNEYEEGISMEFCDEFFSTLRAHIVPLLQKIAEKPQVDDSCLKGDFP